MTPKITCRTEVADSNSHYDKAVPGFEFSSGVGGLRRKTTLLGPSLRNFPKCFIQSLYFPTAFKMLQSVATKLLLALRIKHIKSIGYSHTQRNPTLSAKIFEYLRVSNRLIFLDPIFPAESVVCSRLCCWRHLNAALSGANQCKLESRAGTRPCGW